jgi:hypothetical protein
LAEIAVTGAVVVVAIAGRAGDRHWFERVPGTSDRCVRYREVVDDPDETVAEFENTLFRALGLDGANRLVRFQGSDLPLVLARKR